LPTRKRKKVIPDKGLRAELIRVAGELLKKKSADEISLREIARDCGVSEAAPYRHFRNRQDLLSAIATEGFEILREHLSEIVEGKAKGEERFHRAALAYLTMGQKYPAHLKLIFSPIIVPSPDYPELFKAAKLSFLTLVRILQDCQKEGVIGEGDLFQRAMHTWMAIHGFTMLFIDCRCEWLGLNKANAEVAMRGFAQDLLQGAEKNRDPKVMGFIPHAQGITEELLREAGIKAELRVAFNSN
jgi:AcrR family transcriptional regulator